MAVPYLRRKDVWVEQQDKSKARVLDTCLYGKGSAVPYRELCKSCSKIACCKGKTVMYKYNDADKVKVLNEQLEVL